MKRIPWQAIGTRLTLFVIAMLVIWLFPGDTPGGNSLYEKAVGRAKNDLFNYVAWEVDALNSKLLESQSGVSPFLTEAKRSHYVHDYLQHVGQLHALERKINDIYSNAAIQDKATASAELTTQRDQLRVQVNSQQQLAESIIEEQVATVLRDEGFGTFGVVIPPVSAHITELPEMLVISLRDKIRLEMGLNIVHLSTDNAAALEDTIDRDLNVSSLIVPLGGLSLYPSMVIESPSIFMFEVAAHEWAHHYLYFFPLGLAYTDAGDSRTINETTASTLGTDIGHRVVRRFYSDYPDIIAQIPPEKTPTPPAQQPTIPEPTITPPEFDFNTELNETRVTVDFLLRFGLVDLAERYMKARQVIFNDHGFVLRKINQAFFAFYGGYQAPGLGSRGTDPIGPAIQEIKQRSPSLKAWFETMRSITTRDQLLATRDTLRKSQADQ